ncbi:coatomer protein [Phytophthora cinnamomi]|uniref:coatomer protein n=1 Tax=Phytophthora cinnamomi TaxID=4785 RepID=UPI003559C23C|nr:coatomer protein [Phytophthora cinnamomi]
MRRHFAQFDDELQDSDQTIATPARHLRPRTRLPTLADASDSDGRARRRFPASAFFSDTTDDDTPRPTARPSGRAQLSMSAYSRPNQPQSSRAPLHMSAGPRRRSERAAQTPRLHLDAIQFPVTRSVLWDRRQLSAEPIGVALGQVLPQFILTAEALKEVHRLFGEQKSARSNGAVLCYLYGDATMPRLKKVVLQGVKMTREDARAAGACGAEQLS